MDIKGSQKIPATREQVFKALLIPEVLKNSIPGCNEVEDLGDNQLKLVITTGIPGFKGPYMIFLHIGEIEAPAHLVLTTNPTSSVGTVKARCVVDLSEEAEHTLLSYNAHAEMEGKIASTPDIILKPMIKGAMDNFFKNFEKQVRSIPA